MQTPFILNSFPDDIVCQLMSNVLLYTGCILTAWPRYIPRTLSNINISKGFNESIGVRENLFPNERILNHHSLMKVIYVICMFLRF